MYNNENKLQIKKFNEILRQGRKTKRDYFLGKTFSAKLFIRLFSGLLEPSIICFEILNFETENRTKEEIETVLNWIKNLNYFYEFISIKETEESRNQILRQLILLLYRKIFYKNTIIKKNNKMNKYVFIILEGFLIKLNLVFYRQVLSVEDYLLYLIKMEILNEKEIIDKCKLLNKPFINIDTNTIEEFFKKNNNPYNYLEMKEKALEELIQQGIIFLKENKSNKNKNENLDYKINSIENYTKIFLFKSNPKMLYDNKKAYYNFYLGKYINNCILEKGQYVGTFLNEEINDSSRYLTNDKCIVAAFNKEKNYTDELYKAFKEKMKRIFQEIKNNYLIFHNIQDDIFYTKYIPYMHYHKYSKGEKIFVQNSIYEGIYILTNGSIKINLNTSIDEMYKLINHLTYSLKNFSENLSQIDDKIVYKENSKNIINNTTRELNLLYSKKDVYDLITIKDYNIIGTNELYDYKTNIYNFSAECISDFAVIYFFPKSHLNSLLKSQKTIHKSFIHLVEFRIKDVIWKLKKNINTFEKKLNNNKNTSIKIKMDNFIKNLKKENIKNNIISRNVLSDVTDSSNNIFLERKDIDKIKKTNQTKLSYNIKINLNKDIKMKTIKKLFFENEDNKKSHHTEKNNRKIPKNLSGFIPSILMNQGSNRKENGICYSITKEKNVNYLPKIFPFVIKDHLNKNYFFTNRNSSSNLIKSFNTINCKSTIKLKRFIRNKSQC